LYSPLKIPAKALLNSLKVRLILSLLAMVIIILPSVAFIIMSSFEKHMLRGVENELTAYSYAILAVAEVEDEHLLMPELLMENQFNISNSGLYAYIAKQNINQGSSQPDIELSASTLWRSESLLTINLPLSLPKKNTELVTGKNAFSSFLLNGEAHFIYSYAVSFSDAEKNFPLIVHIIRDKQTFSMFISNFKQQLWFGLAILMAIILLLQLIWLMWTLKPLSTLAQEVKAIEQGKVQRLTSLYPKELSPLTSQLNQLLDTEQKQRQRYRNALSDLAHSLKTPLAVLQAQSDISATNQEQINRINTTIEHQLKRAQSAGHASWLLGIEVQPIVDKLLNTLDKIYRQTNVKVAVRLSSNVIFKGDEADLLELLGNLLDNAYKAAKNEISLSITANDGGLIISVEDDGIGVKEQQAQQILERGIRADTYQAGHGVGLAIVRDLVDSYHGELQIKHSENLGGAKFYIVFPASTNCS
jgi:two-component system sensor histidine kinase PhoQ